MSNFPEDGVLVVSNLAVDDVLATDGVLEVRVLHAVAVADLQQVPL